MKQLPRKNFVAFSVQYLKIELCKILQINNWTGAFLFLRIAMVT
jgi:hypothetical protein